MLVIYVIAILCKVLIVQCNEMLHGVSCVMKSFVILSLVTY